MNDLNLGNLGSNYQSLSSYMPSQYGSSQLGQQSQGLDVSSLIGGYNQSGAGAQAGGFMDRFLPGMLSTTDTNTGMKTQGWGGLALGGAQALLGGYMGFKQLGLAKDQMRESRRQFDLNYNSQRKLTNSRLEDRQRSRLAQGGNYESVGDYMNKYGV